VTSNTVVANLNADLLDGFNSATANTANTVAVRDASGNLSANFFVGNGSALTGITASQITGVTSIANGTSSVTIPDAGGNVNTNVNGSTRFVTTSTGANVTGNLGVSDALAVTGNITTGANLVTNLIVGRTTGITITATGTDQNITLVPTGTGTVDVSSKRITNLATPSASTDAATKQYVDDVAQGLTVKAACKAATTGTLAVASGGTITYNNGISGVGATLTTTGTFTAIDGVTLANGDRILVKNETTAANNGIYVRTSTTVLTRATDFDNSPSGEVSGAFTFISGGTVNGDDGFVCTTDDPVVMGTTAINFPFGANHSFALRRSISGFSTCSSTCEAMITSYFSSGSNSSKKE
jgi:hypothetical protein